jgi:MFS family permease
MLAMMGGMNMQMVARAQLTWDITHSAIAVSLVGAGFAPPVLLLSIFGGAMADRLDRRRVIQVGQAITMSLAVIVGVLIVTDRITLWWLIGSSVGQGVAWAFLMPARQSIVPQLVGKGHTTNAIALNAGAMSLMTLIAPGIAGVIYARVGVAPAYFIIAALNALAVVLTARVPRMTGAGAAQPSRRVMSEMKDGIRYTFRNQTVLVLLLLALFTTVLAQPFRSLMPVFVHDVFDRGPEAVGLMLSAIGLGALLGTVVIAGLREGEHRGFVLLGTTAVSGVALVLATVTAQYWIAVAVMVLLGVGDSGRRSLNSSLMLEQTQDAFRGRVMGLYMMNFGLIPLGAIPLAAISEVIGIRWAIAGAGALLVAAALSTSLFTDRIRRL